MRLAAMAVLFQFLLSAGAPLFASDSQANVPACCRRGGKHHCMAMAHAGPERGETLQAAHSKCPVWPASAVTQSRTRQWLLQVSRPYHPALVAHSGIYRQFEDSGRTAGSSQQKRGPPALPA